MTAFSAPVAPGSPAVAEAAQPAPERPSDPPAGRAIWRRVRFWSVFALVVAIGAVFFTIWQSKVPQGHLNIDAPTPEGARAAAVLLRAHGIDVRQRKDIAASIDRAEQGNVTLFLAEPAMLSAESMRRIAKLPRTVRIVVPEPDDFIFSDLGLDVAVVGANSFPIAVPPECSFPEAQSAGDAEVGQYRYSRKGTDTLCYRGSLAVATVDGGAEVVALGSETPITNDRLDEEGNAALVLGLLSSHNEVVWLRPSAPETSAETQRVSFQDLLPPWVVWAELLLLLAAVLAVFWRMRRIGPPVAEPLPVVVRSAETAEGRARMYRRARARPEAYEALRAGAMARLLPALGLGSEPEYRAVTEAIADRTGAPAGVVYAVLYGPPPAGDAALVAAADTLDALVRDVLHPRRPADLNRPDGEGPTQ